MVQESPDGVIVNVEEVREVTYIVSHFHKPLLSHMSDQLKISVNIPI